MKKYTLTPEQAAARNARREKFRALVKQVAEMTDEQRAEIVPGAGAVVTCEGRALSRTNTILCMIQRPGVSMVGGFRQWITQGRCVKKGEHGMQIWIPVSAGKRDGSSAEVPGEPVLPALSVKFGTGTVFSIEQTEPLPAMSPVVVVDRATAQLFGIEHLANVRLSEEVEMAI